MNTIPLWWTCPLLDPKTVDVSRLRIAFHTDNGVMAAVEDVKKAVETAVSTMKNAGSTVEHDCPKPLGRLMDILREDITSDGGEHLKVPLGAGWYDEMEPFP